MQTCARTTTSAAQTTHTERAKSWLAPVAVQSRRQVRCLATTPVCAGCVTGSLDAGTPKGIDTTIAGVDCYLSKPQTPNGHAVILATDIFGYKLINARLIADVFAENGYLTVIPDYFKNDALDMKMLELSESLPSQSLLGKIGTYAQLAGQIIGMASWFPRHPVSHAVEVVTAVATALRADHGIRNIGVQGYCYGGKVCALMAAKPDVVSAVCTAHPSILKVPDDIQAMKVPALFLCAEKDAQFPANKLSAAIQASQQTAPGTPKGIDTTIAGVDCYLSRPQSPNGHALILATDIFGYKLINARLIADVFAENGYLTVIPDYFKNDALDMKMLELSESLPSQSLLGKIGLYAQLVGQIIGMASWFPRHPVGHAVEVVTAVAAALRANYGIKNIGVQGYCYGGKVCALMAAKPDVVNAVCTAHPSILKVPDDIQAMKVPALFLCAETDAQFPAHKRSAAIQASQQTAPGRDTYILYKGTNHGFAVRGNKANPAVNAAREHALQQGVKFFQRTLCGVSAAEEQEAPGVGVVLTSA